MQNSKKFKKIQKTKSLSITNSLAFFPFSPQLTTNPNLNHLDLCKNSKRNSLKFLKL